MKIAIAQLDPVVGAVQDNTQKILSAYEEACRGGARVCITPELSLFGYPAHDLLDRPEIFEKNEAALEELKKATRGKKCALVVGHVSRNPEPTGKAAQNTLSVLDDGKEAHRQSKHLLPTYDVFDEARYFEPGKELKLWTCDGKKVGFAICEDLWAAAPKSETEAQKRKLYQDDPVDLLAKLKPELLITISASPYEQGKLKLREELHSKIAKRLKCELVYVNQTGATDEIIFDGGSFWVDAQGVVQGRLAPFETVLSYVEQGQKPKALDETTMLAQALVTGIASYFKRTGFNKAILGLSGGIDSAVVAALAVKALGPKNVLGVAMPSHFSSSHSLEDAEALAKNLGIKLEVQPIKFSFIALLRQLSENRGGKLLPVAEENMQARLRGVMLMTLSNHEGSLVLTTGNKSELAMGYCTLYGDMVGALAPIGDLYKTRVYELARTINQIWGPTIPLRSIEKAPSAELRPNQTDQDSLPPYEKLDPVLKAYLEDHVSAQTLAEQNGDWVKSVLRILELNEYKRRQAAPVLKVSPKAFGIGRRIPIAKK